MKVHLFNSYAETNPLKGPDQIRYENGSVIAYPTTPEVGAEIVRRWNAHAELEAKVARLEELHFTAGVERDMVMAEPVAVLPLSLIKRVVGWERRNTSDEREAIAELAAYLHKRDAEPPCGKCGRSGNECWCMDGKSAEPAKEKP